MGSTPNRNEAGNSATRADRQGGVLRRLIRDTRGNTLAMVGAALVPLAGMIGSGVDLSRAYMARTRLQSACDAATLAGRRVMTNDTLSQEVTDEANKFFNFNFQQGLYETATFTPVVTRPEAGTVRIEAATTIPTVIMHMFGYETLPLAVECEASQNFVNTDVVLVLDVTGSMAVTTDGVTQIQALRDAVMALYDELAPVQAQLEANGMRLRYGIVPYSSSVNIGDALIAADSNYVANSWTYQSRVPVYSTSSAAERVGTNMTSDQCNAYRRSRSPANSFPATQKITVRPGSGNRRPCDVITITYSTDDIGDFADLWYHDARVLDTSVFKTGASTPVPTRYPGTTRNSEWSGCIEERDTVDTINGSSGYSIPDGAWDLNINHVPDSDATRWRPHWPEVIYTRGGTAAQTYLDGSGQDDGDSYRQRMTRYAAAAYACPAPARRLQAWTRGNMQTYVDALEAIGGTYHDIGMIWGARFISAGGVFGTDNPDTFNGMPVAKHVIFMSDGQLAPNDYTYTSYGIEELDQRVTGSSSASGQLNRHSQRFKMICNSARGMNVSIWVVAFNTAVDSGLSECASSASQTVTAANRDELIEKFTEIGKNIGALRLTQ